ncbi:MAG: type III pantothenate kinase, partial [Candidatus Omnitrophota bacterium]
MERLIAIDIGNTNVVCGVFWGKRLLKEYRIATKACRNSTRTRKWLKKIVGRCKGEEAILCSVVPWCTQTVKKASSLGRKKGRGRNRAGGNALPQGSGRREEKGDKQFLIGFILLAATIGLLVFILSYLWKNMNQAPAQAAPDAKAGPEPDPADIPSGQTTSRVAGLFEYPAEFEPVFEGSVGP